MGLCVCMCVCIYIYIYGTKECPCFCLLLNSYLSKRVQGFKVSLGEPLGEDQNFGPLPSTGLVCVYTEKNQAKSFVYATSSSFQVRPSACSIREREERWTGCCPGKPEVLADTTQQPAGSRKGPPGPRETRSGLGEGVGGRERQCLEDQRFPGAAADSRVSQQFWQANTSNRLQIFLNWC